MNMYSGGAQAGWGAPPTGGYEDLAFAQHVRQVGWDVPVKAYEDTGTVDNQLPEKTETAR